MIFLETIRRRYATFSGRASRKEFWVYTGYKSAIGLVLFFLTKNRFPGNAGLFLIASFEVMLFTPSLAVAVRRLHDQDLRGQWLFLNLLPIIGPLVILAFLLRRGTESSNRFGAAADSSASDPRSNRIGFSLAILVLIVLAIISQSRTAGVVGAIFNRIYGIGQSTQDFERICSITRAHAIRSNEQVVAQRNWNQEMKSQRFGEGTLRALEALAYADPDRRYEIFLNSARELGVRTDRTEWKCDEMRDLLTLLPVGFLDFHPKSR